MRCVVKCDPSGCDWSRCKPHLIGPLRAILAGGGGNKDVVYNVFRTSKWFHRLQRSTTLRTPFKNLELCHVAGNWAFYRAMHYCIARY